MRSLVTRASAALALAAGALVVPATPASAYPAAEVRLEGHGFGHGRGMGQYGALGYALDHWTYTQILDHFYGRTALRSGWPNDDIHVRMVQNDGRDLIVTSESAFTIAGNDGKSVSLAPVQVARIRRIGPAAFAIDRGPGCGGPWEQIDTESGQPEARPVVPDPDQATRAQMIQGCFPEGIRWLRGTLRAHDDKGVARTINRLRLESYLRGVVPRESPASWGELGGGAGTEALKAQAVAARSYAVSEEQSNGGMGRYGYAQTCNTEACQVYGGVALQDGSGFSQLEDARSDTTVSVTAGQIRVPNGVTAVASRTEFSSSTGGYTAGGVFPVVPDDGDDVSYNPYHTWRASVPVARVEAAFPEIGRLVSLDVTKRNGLGDWGGRVLEMRIDGTASSIATTGNTFRSRLGLRSDWFRILHPAGYWILGADGGVFTFGNAGFYGSTGAMRLAKPVVGMEATPSKAGYWLVASDGGIFSFGDAQFYGSTGTMRLAKPVIGMASTGSGGGYWLLAADGGIFSFGDAQFFGSTGAMKLNQPIVGMAATPSGRGYWLVASNGGIFSFGDAQFFGSTGAIRLNRPVIGMAATPSGGGYWILASDGGIFSFGDAQFFGSTGAIKLNQPIVGMAATPSGGGYYLLARDGGIFTFGDAQFFGSVPGVAPASTTAKIDIAVSYTQ